MAVTGAKTVLEIAARGRREALARKTKGIEALEKQLTEAYDERQTLRLELTDSTLAELAESRVFRETGQLALTSGPEPTPDLDQLLGL